MTALQMAVSRQSKHLKEFINKVKYASGREGASLDFPDRETHIDISSGAAGSRLTAQLARQITELVLEISYIKEAPPDIQSEQLLRSVSLALWIGWAYARDVKYWKKAADVPGSDAWDEQFAWEDVRRALFSLGVPNELITVNGKIPTKSGILAPVPRHFRKPDATGLNMWGFLNWVNGPAPRSLLFAGLPKNAKGLEMVEDQMANMHLTPTGWVRMRRVNEKAEKAQIEAARARALRRAGVDAVSGAGGAIR
jgi:hypothetical protein